MDMHARRPDIIKRECFNNCKFSRCELFAWLPHFAFCAEYSVHVLPVVSGIVVPFYPRGRAWEKVSLHELDREGTLAQTNSEEQEFVAKFAEDPNWATILPTIPGKSSKSKNIYLWSTLVGLKVYYKLAPMFLVRDCTHGTPWAKSSLASRPFPLGLAKMGN